MNKPQSLQSWIIVKDNPGVEYETITWIDKQEWDFKRLQLKEIKISNTELGKQVKMILSEALAVTLSDTQVKEIKAALPNTPLTTDATLSDTQL